MRPHPRATRPRRRWLASAPAFASACAATLLVGLVGLGPVLPCAHAQTTTEATPPTGESLPTPAEPGTLERRDPELAPPPPTNVAYLQYGVAFTGEIPSVHGAICRNANVPCVLGAGGGITVRVGVRSAGALYVAGAYELTKQDPNNLYRFATLQQARVEGRFYLNTARAAYPYVSGAVGAAGYGNEWQIDTYGPLASLGAGLELQVSRRTVLGVGLVYRFLYLSSFVDTSGAARAGGITQLIGFDFLLEQRDPIVRAAPDDRPVH